MSRFHDPPGAVIDLTALRGNVALLQLSIRHVTLAWRAPDVRLVNHAPAWASLAVRASCAVTAGRGQVAAQQVEE
jgi:hypothetical protein